MSESQRQAAISRHSGLAAQAIGKAYDEGFADGRALALAQVEAEFYAAESFQDFVQCVSELIGPPPRPTEKDGRPKRPSRDRSSRSPRKS